MDMQGTNPAERYLVIRCLMANELRPTLPAHDGTSDSGFDRRRTTRQNRCCTAMGLEKQRLFLLDLVHMETTDHLAIVTHVSLIPFELA
jgi:hypothetical protein